MTEEKSNARALTKIVIVTVLACIGFLVVFGVSVIYVFALTLNMELSLILGFLIGAAAMFTFVAVLRPSKGSPLVLSRKQKIGTFFVAVVIFVSSLPLIRIAPLLFPSCLPAPVAVIFILIYDALRTRKRKEMSKNEKAHGLWNYTAVACIVNELKPRGQSGNTRLPARCVGCHSMWE